MVEKKVTHLSTQYGAAVKDETTGSIFLFLIFYICKHWLDLSKNVSFQLNNQF